MYWIDSDYEKINHLKKKETCNLQHTLRKRRIYMLQKNFLTFIFFVHPCELWLNDIFFSQNCHISRAGKTLQFHVALLRISWYKKKNWLASLVFSTINKFREIYNVSDDEALILSNNKFLDKSAILLVLKLNTLIVYAKQITE